MSPITGLLPGRPAESLRPDYAGIVTTPPDEPVRYTEIRALPAVLSRQARRPPLRPADRAFLAALARLLPHRRRHGLVVTPQTLLPWQRKLLREWTQPRGRPPIGTATPRWPLRSRTRRFATNLTAPPATAATTSRQLPRVAVSDDVAGRPCSASSGLGAYIDSSQWPPTTWLRSSSTRSGALP